MTAPCGRRAALSASHRLGAAKPTKRSGAGDLFPLTGCGAAGSPRRALESRLLQNLCSRRCGCGAPTRSRTTSRMKRLPPPPNWARRITSRGLPAFTFASATSSGQQLVARDNGEPPRIVRIRVKVATARPTHRLHAPAPASRRKRADASSQHRSASSPHMTILITCRTAVIGKSPRPPARLDIIDGPTTTGQ